MSTYLIYSLTISVLVVFVVRPWKYTFKIFTFVSAFPWNNYFKLYLKGRGVQKIAFINCKSRAKIQQTAQTVVLCVHFPKLLNRYNFRVTINSYTYLHIDSPSKIFGFLISTMTISWILVWKVSNTASRLLPKLHSYPSFSHADTKASLSTSSFPNAKSTWNTAKSARQVLFFVTPQPCKGLTYLFMVYITTLSEVGWYSNDMTIN